ncbi:MAG: GtrA family protein, partial [Azonexus sp.]|nr:GtrA family protein [Azonexus sp.]
VVVALVSSLGAAPANANIGGWLVAFVVSFCGHYFLTFRRAGASWWQAAWRFYLISVLGFAINEIAYILLLRVSALPYDLLLAIVLVAIAVLTFFASRLWAFRLPSI